MAVLSKHGPEVRRLVIELPSHENGILRLEYSVRKDGKVLRNRKTRYEEGGQCHRFASGWKMTELNASMVEKIKRTTRGIVISDIEGGA